MNIEQFENILCPPPPKIKNPFTISRLWEAIEFYHQGKIIGYSVICPHCKIQSWPTTSRGASKCSSHLGPRHGCSKLISENEKLLSIKTTTEEYYFNEE
jgi:hypothetical protein